MADLAAQVTASWKGTHGGADIPPNELAYWVGKASHPEVYSDGVTRIGWNRYWETRMMPDNDGSADPKLGDLPARYQPEATMTIQETLAQVRAKYPPTTTNDQSAAICNETAWIHRNDPEKWGVNLKPNGESGTLSDGSKIACDIIQNGVTKEAYDVLVGGSGGGPATPKWELVTPPITDPSRPWKAPIDPGTQPPPVDPPPVDPPPTGSDTQKILDAIAKHDKEIKEILVQTRLAAAATLAKLKNLTLEGEAKVWGQTIKFTLKPKV